MGFGFQLVIAFSGNTTLYWGNDLLRLAILLTSFSKVQWTKSVGQSSHEELFKATLLAPNLNREVKSLLTAMGSSHGAYLQRDWSSKIVACKVRQRSGSNPPCVSSRGDRVLLVNQHIVRGRKLKIRLLKINTISQIINMSIYQSTLASDIQT